MHLSPLVCDMGEREEGNPLWNKTKNQKSKLLYNFNMLLNVSRILHPQTSAHIWAERHDISLYLHDCTAVIYAAEQPGECQAKGTQEEHKGNTQRVEVLRKGEHGKGRGCRQAVLSALRPSSK